jgi:membrane protein DedA with SNARE-associated domain
MIAALFAAPLLLFIGRTGDLIEGFAALGDQAAEYGYAAIVLVVAGDGVFPLFPGETAIVAAAVLASQGTLNLYLVILAGAVGAMLGDSTAYGIGRLGEDRLRAFMIRMAGRERVDIAERMVERHGPALVFVGRFIPGLRIGINMACGAGLMPYRRFLLFNSLGSFFWSTQAALLGFFAGKAFADQIWVAFVVAIGLTLVVGGVVALKERQHVKRERARRAAAESASPPV